MLNPDPEYALSNCIPPLVFPAVKQFHRHHDRWPSESNHAQQMKAITRMPDQKVIERYQAEFIRRGCFVGGK